MLEKLKNWFEREKRDLPWRQETTPYRVWISEIMLQQTRASVVKEYFNRWMKKYPSIQTLACALEEDVIKLWEGLGYYNRARNILKAAQYFVENHKGQIPCDRDLLLKVPGLGPYTVGAILSFAFKQKAAAVDGNVARVMSRYYAFEEEICSVKSYKKLSSLTEQLLEDKEPFVVMEALIELGATLCGKPPQCLRCPLQAACQGHLRGIADNLPKKKKPKKNIFLIKEIVVLKFKDFLLVKKMPKGKVLGGLYEFLSIDHDIKLDVKEYLKKYFDVDAYKIQQLDQEQYTYTHHAVELFPSIWETSHKTEISGYEWIKWQDIFLLPFTSGHRRILSKLRKEI